MLRGSVPQPGAGLAGWQVCLRYRAELSWGERSLEAFSGFPSLVCQLPVFYFIWGGLIWYPSSSRLNTVALCFPPSVHLLFWKYLGVLIKNQFCGVLGFVSCYFYFFLVLVFFTT